MTFLVRRSILACFAATVMAAALAACAAVERGQLREERDKRANVYPQNYKSDLLAYLRVYLNDPTNVRDAYVAEPAIKNVGFGNRYVVCVRFNAKNSEGRYLGSKEGMAIFAEGRLDQFSNRAREQCSQADYKPFPELEALSR